MNDKDEFKDAMTDGKDVIEMWDITSKAWNDFYKMVNAGVRDPYALLRTIGLSTNQENRKYMNETLKLLEDEDLRSTMTSIHQVLSKEESHEN